MNRMLLENICLIHTHEGMASTAYTTQVPLDPSFNCLMVLPKNDDYNFNLSFIVDGLRKVDCPAETYKAHTDCAILLGNKALTPVYFPWLIMPIENQRNHDVRLVLSTPHGREISPIEIYIARLGF